MPSSGRNMIIPTGKRIFTVVAVMTVLLLGSLAQASVFACKDNRGAVRFTNAPTDGSCTPFELDSEIEQRVWQPPADGSSYDPHIWAMANRYSLDPYLIKAIILAESGFNTQAISRRGAQGLMQLMPATARELRVQDSFNPHQNIEGGTKYLRYLMNTFSGNLVLSLAAYNAGPGAVMQARGIPRISETARYVVKVLKNYRSYRKGLRG
jgi:soluble lytic murein transglycosylase-like protein